MPVNKIVVSEDTNVVKVVSEGIQGAAGSTSFVNLSDTPANFVAGKVLKVNGAANAIEYADDINTTNLSYTASTRVLASDTGSNATLPLVTTADPGLLSASDKSKLDGIEANSKDDQTGAEIKALYEAESNTNAYTDAEKTKLTAIEDNATADQTGSEIKSLYEGESDTNAFTDAEKNKLTGIESNATADQTDAEIRAAVEAATDSNVFTDADHSKLNGIEVAATADQTASEIKTLYESNSDTNEFSDAEQSKLAGIEDNATADQTDAEIKTAYENNSNTNAYTDAEKSKLAAIEASADVTDATNVNAAGAVMNTDSTTAAMGFVVDEDDMASNSATKVPTQQSVKAYFDANSSDTTYTAGTGLSLSGTTFNVDQIALTTVQTAANESAHLALTTQEGDIVVRTDQNKSYVKNSGTAGTMADFTELLTPTDQVLSVAGNTGAVTAAQIAAAVEAASNSNTFTDADHSKLDGIENNATADQTATEIKTAYESNSNTNAYTDAEQTKLSGVEANATADQTSTEIKSLLASDKLTGTHLATDSVSSTQIANDSITANELANNSVGDSHIIDGTITNSEISGSAAIAGTKISPDFGSQNITTTGDLTVSGGDITLNGTSCLLNFNDTNNNPDFRIQIESGNFLIEDATNSYADRFVINSSGNVGINNNNPSESLDVTGNIAVSGTVDGRDLATDGSKLDGIAAGAEVNVNADWNSTSGDSQILNKPTIPTNNNQLTNGANFIDGSALNASNLNSGTIPDARFPNVLPAISGANLTNLPAANFTSIASNIVSDSDNTRTIGTTSNNFATVFTRQVKGNNNNFINFATNGDIGITSKSGSAVELKGGSNSRGLFIGNTGVIPTHSAVNLGTSSNKYNEIHAQYFHGDGSNLTNLPSSGNTDKITEGNTEAEVVDTGSDGHFKVTTEGTERFRVDSNGKCGIGTSSPSDLLDLYNSTNNSRVVRISHPQYPTAAAAFFGWSSDGSGTTNNLFNIGVQYSSSYYNVINIKRSEQKVGINNNNPSESLDVTGNIKASGTIDGTLKNGVTATTATTGDNTTKVATTAFIQTALSNYIATGSNIQNNAITTAKIADSTGTTTGVTTAKLANDAVTSQKLANNTISTDKLQNDSVTTPKLNLISTSSVPSLEAKGDGSSQDGYIQLNCSQNSHGVKIKSPPHSAGASYTLTLPDDTGSANQVLKTNGSGGLDWVDQTAAYTNASVDAHLNQSNPTSGHVLSWNGSDYAWVAQSSGGGGGISNLVEDTTPQLGGNLDMQANNISGTGTVIANSTAVATAGMRKIHASTSAPSGSDGAIGDLWVKF